MIRLFVTLALCLSCLAQTPADAERNRKRWNGRFTDETFHFNRDANRFLQQATADLEPGLALDIDRPPARERHDPERILFGTDSPWGDTARHIAYVRDFPVAPEVKELIFHRNAHALLGLDPPLS